MKYFELLGTNYCHYIKGIHPDVRKVAVPRLYQK